MVGSTHSCLTLTGAEAVVVGVEVEVGLDEAVMGMWRALEEEEEDVGTDLDWSSRSTRS